MNHSIELLNQILDMAREQAKLVDAYHILIHKASRTLATNPVVFYLEQLKELIPLEYENKLTPNSEVNIQGKVMEVSLGGDVS